MAIRILGIGGSPRRGGNSDILLDAALMGARSAGARTEKIVLNDIEFMACQECGGCDRTGRCIIRDGMGPIYKKIDNSDGIIAASPVFFGSISAQLKMMIDRFQCAWVMKYVLKKGNKEKKRRGVFICVSGAGRSKHFRNAREIVRNYFATAGIVYHGDLYIGGVDSLGDIRNKKTAMRRARDMGSSLTRSLK